MESILELFKNILPVIAFIGVGYFLKKKFDFNASYITKPLLYFLLPILVIDKVTEADPSKIAILAGITFIAAFSMNLPAILVKKTFGKDENINFLKSGFTFFNVAFFGVPIVNALFGAEGLSILFCIYIGSAFYGDTIGYFQVARTKLSVRDSIKRVLKTPYVYTFILAIVLKVADFKTPEELDPFIEVVGWLVSALGMTIVGLGVSGVNIKKIDFKYFSKLLGLRLVAAIFFLGILILIESITFKQLEEKDLQILGLLSVFPIASNISLFAAFIKTEEEKFSLLVLLSIAVSLVLVPLVVLFF